jgi:response regulator RpfG family c-di-GMP phosphodiesterase
MTQDKILFVDDDANLLASCRRTFHRKYNVTTAEGGDEGLRTLRDDGPFAVVFADMRMPGMNGIQFLAWAKDVSPDTVRIMLTGNADLSTALEAVNEGAIFRFLTKPCPAEVLTLAVEAGIEQYRLITAERELLEKTLNGSITILTDILSITRPKAFGRAQRVSRYVRRVVEELGLSDAWKYEMAGMLSQLGCVSLSDELIEKYFSGQDLADEEKTQFLQHPQWAKRMLSNIPRLQPVAGMISRQAERDPWLNEPERPDVQQRDPVALGGQILKAVLVFDQDVSHGVEPALAIEMLRKTERSFDPVIVDALAKVEVEVPRYATWAVRIDEIQRGMLFDQDVRAVNGNLLVTRGQEATRTILEHLIRWAKNVGVDEPIRVLVPIQEDLPAPTSA